MKGTHRAAAVGGSRESRGIKKQQRRAANIVSKHPLVGRCVAVPQRYAGVEDDGDGFCFNATIIEADTKRALIKYEYTGEKERWNLEMINKWLQPDHSALCDSLLSGMSVSERVSGELG